MAQRSKRVFYPEADLGTTRTQIVPSEILFYDRSNEVSRFGGPRGPIAMFTDGACPGNGQPWAKASYGVFSAQGSPRNSYGLLPSSTNPTNNKAEIFAAQKAVDIISNDVNWQPWKDGVVLVTDSDYLFGSMTNYLDTWVMNGFLTASGLPVSNADAIVELDDKIRQLNDCGINIRFWGVSRVHNQDADRLANLALGT